MTALRFVLAKALVAALAVASSSHVAGAPPVTERRPVTDEYHGTRVVDQYRWLENWEDAAVKRWSETQNVHARAYLDSIAFAPQLRERVTELENAVGPRYLEVHFAGGVYFAAKSLPGKQQPMIVAMRSLSDPTTERTIVDPNVLDAGGGTSFDWFVPSPDGKLLAVSLSSGGSESGDARIFDVATGTERVADRVARVNGGTAGGSLAWDADGKGFLYSRYPREGERPAEDLDFYTQVYHHTLGTPVAEDSYQVGKDYPKIAEIQVETSEDGRWALTNVQNGDGGEFIQDVRTPKGEWVRISTWADRIVEAKFATTPSATGPRTSMYLVSRAAAPMGKVLRLELTDDRRPALADAVEIVPERSDASIETDFTSRGGILMTHSRLFVLYQIGGPNELRVFDLAGGAVKPLGTVASLPISTVQHVGALDGDAIVFQNESFIDPPAWFTLASASGGAGTVAATPLRQALPPNMPALAVRREMATSRDGTKVPVNIVARKDLLAAHEGSGATAPAPGPAPAPTVVWGYGGYGVNETPTFSRRTILMAEQGGIYAFANIRGGGEYGERWHTEGNLTRKQNVFDDFQAVCAHLVSRHYTTPERMAIFGGSNGGLLMGATFTQRPDLCKAVVSSVGIYDMLRVELSANGAFNITEFGTVCDRAQFDALYAYSPYHRVKDGTKYPAVLFLTGANDPRVDPMQSRKMTALLQAAQASIPADRGGPSPVYLRTSGNTGHGMGTPLGERIEQTVDTFAFIMDQLGVRYVRPGSR
jgi:prolyl oligopeptidase